MKKKKDCVNLLLCGNQGFFDGMLTLLISILNKTDAIINCYIYTMDATRLNDSFTPVSDKQIKLLNELASKKNPGSKVTKIDVGALYEQEFKNCPNEQAYCTPYTLLRLLADLVPDMPDKLLYLDGDMMANKDILELWNINIDDYEYAAVREKYGCWIIRFDYINAGMLLLNMKMIRETKLLEKARESLRKVKLTFADQDAVYWNTTKKKLINRKFNEQSSVKNKNTVICHFCKRLKFLPYPHTTNYKQWDIEKINKELHCHMFDEDLKEYIKIKGEYNE